MDNKYDSREDTLNHIDKVADNIYLIIGKLTGRVMLHDRSKLNDPEKSFYDKVVPEIQKHEYGTPGYKKATKLLGDGLKHHYANNRHHPEHFENGIADMTLIDIVEMVCDWKAASERNVKKSDLLATIDKTLERFDIDPESLLGKVIKNTLDELKW